MDYRALNKLSAPFYELRSLASELRSHIAQRHHELDHEYSEWEPRNDARLTAFESLLNIARYAELSFHYIAHHLCDPDYWTAFRPTDVSIDRIAFECGVYAQCSKVAFFQMSFAAVESSHGAFLRAIDPDRASAARNYSDVYKQLLKTLPGDTGPDAELLGFLRRVRNTIHAEGVYRGKSRTLRYRGRRYVFVDGEALGFLPWRFVLALTADVVLLQDRIVRALASHEGTIPDVARPNPRLQRTRMRAPLSRKPFGNQTDEENL